jgi:hypothetical protein
MWTTIGLLFGGLTERAMTARLQSPMTRRRQDVFR